MLFTGLFLFVACTGAQRPASAQTDDTQPIPGAWQTKAYLPLLEHMQVAVVANHTSILANGVHLVDTLLRLQVSIRAVFSPEHGFRGTADAGETVRSEVDPSTNIPVISLYGSHKKPTPKDLDGIDLVLFDLQDVGTRFYTYISTLHYVMEACAEAHIPVIVLDRPNPNAHYVDGPVLEPDMQSFVGMHPVPVVYGLTIGEYATMISGEGWLSGKVSAQLTVIPCVHYTHRTPYQLPVPPSPNLQDIKAVLLYPSLCFFEGTPCSVGRGTAFPFMVFGHPDMQDAPFTFTPQPTVGAKSPLLSGQICHGMDLRTLDRDSLYRQGRINLSWIIWAYHHFPRPEEFFTSYFDTLAGTATLRKQIIQGLTEQQIRQTWQPQIEAYLHIRRKYLLYE